VPALRIPVYYDFASTLCHVAHRVMLGMTDDLSALDVALEWRPVDLTRITGWRRHAPVDGPRRENALRVARELGVPVRMPAHWPDSRGAHLVALGLPSDAKRAAWRERVWSAVHEEGRPIDEPTELTAIAADLDIDAPALVTRAALSRLAADTRAARSACVTGVPTFQLGTFPMAGIQDPTTMLLTLKRFAHHHRTTT
jgi:predicted DsbA family dithiol-disulfide isomerase